jgi:hypothetical protein
VGRDFCKDKPIVKCQRHKTTRRTSYKKERTFARLISFLFLLRQEFFYSKLLAAGSQKQLSAPLERNLADA